jgi:hypothetical protein
MIDPCVTMYGVVSGIPDVKFEPNGSQRQHTWWYLNVEVLRLSSREFFQTPTATARSTAEWIRSQSGAYERGRMRISIKQRHHNSTIVVQQINSEEIVVVAFTTALAKDASPVEA